MPNGIQPSVFPGTRCPGCGALYAGACCFSRTPTRGVPTATDARSPWYGTLAVCMRIGGSTDVGVHYEGRHVDVVFSLTSPMCPVADQIHAQVETETLSIEGVETVNAQLSFDPLWTPEMMSPAAKLFFGR